MDDDVDTAEILADVLRGEGHKVRVARDGREGLALVDVDQPDLVIVDVEMPRLSGPEMAHQMFLHDLGLQDIPIILCSGVLNLADIASRVGTPYYLTKPYTLDAILGLVSRVLVERTPPVPHPATRQR